MTDITESLKEQALKLADELAKVISKMNKIDPPIKDEDYGYLSYASNNRVVVDIAKTIAYRLLKEAKTDGYSGCLLCGS